jgi:hypothetical protein
MGLLYTRNTPHVLSLRFMYFFIFCNVRQENITDCQDAYVNTTQNSNRLLC